MIAKKCNTVNGFETIGGFFAFGGGFAPFQSVTAVHSATKYTCKGRAPWRDVPASGALFGRLPTKGNFFPLRLPRTYNSICRARRFKKQAAHPRAAPDETQQNQANDYDRTAVFTHIAPDGIVATQNKKTDCVVRLFVLSVRITF